MFGHFGFSYIGALWLLMLFIPNGVWAKKYAKDFASLAKKENKILLIFERLGQVLVTACALMFEDFNPEAQFSPWAWWLIASAALMVLYFCAWVRYFLKPQLKNFYRSFLLIPLPLASLPLLAFLLLGIYGKVIWLVISTVILGIGHLGIHIGHVKELKKNK